MLSKNYRHVKLLKFNLIYFFSFLNHITWNLIDMNYIKKWKNIYEENKEFGAFAIALSLYYNYDIDLEFDKEITITMRQCLFKFLHGDA